MTKSTSIIKKEKLIEELCTKLDLKYSLVILKGINLDDYLDNPQYDLYLALVKNLEILDGIDRSNGKDYVYKKNNTHDSVPILDITVLRYKEIGGNIGYCNIVDGKLDNSNYIPEYSDGDDI